MRTVFLCAALAVAGIGIHAASQVLVPILFGLMFAAAAQPLVALVERTGAPTPIPLIAALLAMFLVMTAATATMVLGVLDVAADMPEYLSELRKLQRTTAQLMARSHLPQVARWVMRQDAGTLAGEGVRIRMEVAAEALGFATLSGLVATFGLIERDSLLRRLAGGEPEAQRTWSLILQDTQKYLGIKTLASAATGVLAGAVCWIAGVPNPGLWAAVAFWLNFVPVVGSLLAAVPPVLIALATGGTGPALGVAAGYFVVNMSIGNGLEPRWHGRAAGLSALVVVLSIALWTGLLGTLGAILAVPLTMLVKIGCFHTGDLAWVARLLDEGRLAHSAPHRDEPTDPDDDERRRLSMFG